MIKKYKIEKDTLIINPNYDPGSTPFFIALKSLSRSKRDKIRRIVLPHKMNSISSLLLDNFNGLEDITVPKENSIYSSIDGILFNKDKTIIIRYPPEKHASSYTIPDSVTEIGYGAFSGCKNLKEIFLHDNLKSVGDCAFDGCSELININIPDDVEYIGYQSFHDCRSLLKIILPPKITKIHRATFAGCKNLKNIIIPKSVNKIDVVAFSDCTSLQNIRIPDNVTSLGYGVFHDCINLKSVTFGSYINFIDDTAFKGTNLKEIKFNRVNNRFFKNWIEENGLKYNNSELSDFLDWLS